jgi:nucleoside-diphosphate-sugar epimerase
MKLPETIENEAELDELMTTPDQALVESMSKLEGSLLLLGVGGKMGPTLARLARRALDRSGSSSEVIGVARFSHRTVRDELEVNGVRTIACDLLADDLSDLPDAGNVIYLAARKFGSTGNECRTWAMNAYLPGRVAERFRGSRIVALSTGNVYPLSPAASDGPAEEDPTGPIGEYAQSCLGRERVFEFFSRTAGTPVSIIRLNYAIDLRYGVLVDVATRVHAGQPINIAMGYANVIWQGDANAAILRSIEHCAAPPFVLNLTGPGTISIREIANRFGERFGKTPIFDGNEASDALLSNAGRYVELMGGPAVPIDTMVGWVARWIEIGGAVHNKPTSYQVRDGKF